MVVKSMTEYLICAADYLLLLPCLDARSGYLCMILMVLFLLLLCLGLNSVIMVLSQSSPSIRTIEVLHHGKQALYVSDVSDDCD